MRRLLLVLVVAACSDGNVPLPGPPEPPPILPLVMRAQVAQVTADGAVVAFLTDTPCIATVEYGPTLDASVTDEAPAVEHVFTLSELAPGTTCPYRVRVDGELVSEGRFRTGPGARDPILFVVLGDTGTGSEAQHDLAALFGPLEPDLVLHTGDAVYDRGAAYELDRAYFLPYRDLIDRIPFYVSLGNHDIYADGGQSLLGSLYLPENDADGTERFYSFDAGAAHFVALDSNEDLAAGTQREWLLADLAAHAGAAWTFVFFHKPPYSTGPHGSDLALRANLAPVFEQYGVDVVFNGHDHIYHRSYPMAEDAVVDAAQEPDYTDPKGPVYVVTGAGGKSLYATAPLDFTAFTESAYHFVTVDVRGRTLTLRAIRRDGSEMDRMTIKKGP